MRRSGRRGARPDPWEYWLLALPLGRALAEEGGDALLAVLGLEDLGEALLLGVDARGEVPVVRARLHLLPRERRLLAELACPGQRHVKQLLIGNELVGEAHRSGLRSEDRVTGEVHLEGLRLADQPREALGAAEAGDDPQVDLGLAEDGRLGRHAQVARHGE